jgi:hypothetical protein
MAFVHSELYLLLFPLVYNRTLYKYLRFLVQQLANLLLRKTLRCLILYETSNSDTKYQTKMDGKGVDYKEVANNMF